MTAAFGTDGVRGRAFEELDEVVAHALGRAAQLALGAGGARWFVGRDTRASGPALAAALMAGLRAAGAAVTDLGVVPTPVVAFAAQQSGAAGAMVSASHNPWPDNGVKLFGIGGAKLSDTAEQAVLSQLERIAVIHADRPSVAAVAARAIAETEGFVATEAPAGLVDSYEASLRSAIGRRTLDGLRLVVDAANGACSRLAPALLRRFGAEVHALFCEPDGRNINDGCGSVHPEALTRAVAQRGADLGLAFDGDGDRLIAVDSAGALIDGDRQMLLLATDMAERGLLAQRTLVVTVMSNLGLHQAAAAAGLKLETTAVGDRAVLEALEAGSFSLGGEQSGHIVFHTEATTGDGLRSAVHLADLVARNLAAGNAATSAELAQAAMARAPQVLIGIPTSEGDFGPEVQQKVSELAAAVGPDVRVLVRPSGTEPIIRVMVEAPTQVAAADLAERLASLVRAAGG